MIQKRSKYKEVPKALSGLYSEEVGGGGGGAASAVGPRNFWESAMPTAAQVMDVAARINLPSMVDLVGLMSVRDMRTALDRRMCWSSIESD